MTEAQKWITMFNQKLKEFIQDLIRAYPNDRDFKLWKTSLDMLVNMKPDIPQQLFHQHTEKYFPRIQARDDAFFIHNSEFHDTLSQNDITGEIIDRIHNYWENTADADKEVIWQYLDLLIQLDQRVLKAK